MLQSVIASAQTWRGHRRGGAHRPSLMYVRAGATIWLCALPQHAYIRTRYAPTTMLPHAQLWLPSLYFSRRPPIFQDTAMLRSDLQRITDACKVVGTHSAQYRTTDTVLPFPEDLVPPNVLPTRGADHTGARRKSESFACSGPHCIAREITVTSAEVRASIRQQHFNELSCVHILKA
jgi:hypothetical protein